MSVRAITVVIVLILVASTCKADQDSIGPNGIKASLLNLTGEGIAIGQVERLRPGIPGVDDPFAHEDVIPAAVFRLDGAANSADAGEHAIRVAGVMISKDAGQVKGVAPDSDLYASAYIIDGGTGEEKLRSIEHVASRNNGDVRAINHSYNVPPNGLEEADGFSYLTLGIDWSAAAHNTLHVVAGRNVGEDHFPRITTTAWWSHRRSVMPTVYLGSWTGI
jgi:hypothetical protein